MILNGNTGAHAFYQPDRRAKSRNERERSDFGTQQCVGPLEERFAWMRRRQQARRKRRAREA
jgi:hypothetical protein